jgi:type VI secretion system secreted protein VgrG
VTGPAGLEVYTDPFGRIRVQFSWDRANDDLSGHYTCWLRVSQAWAGATAPAVLFIPRVGMEVVVSFIDGDPDRPLVTGCVYNGDNPTPALLPLQATKSIIRTRSVPMGTGYNELSFEDAMGMERVFLRAERDLSVLVQQDHEARIEGQQRIAIEGAHSQSIGLDENVRVGRHARRTVEGNALETVMGNRVCSVHGVAREQFGLGYDVQIASGGMSTHVPEGEWITDGRGIALRAGSSVLRMTDKEELRDHQNDKGVTLMSFGSLVHVTQDRIELKVGDSSIVITPQSVQVNGKTFPMAQASAPTETPKSGSAV